MKKEETKFKERASADLKLLKNIWFFKSQEVAVRGILDLIICLNGYFIAIELKTNIGKLDALQTHNIGRIRRKGKGLAFTATPANWNKIYEKLERIDNGLPAYKKPVIQAFDYVNLVIGST